MVILMLPDLSAWKEAGSRSKTACGVGLRSLKFAARVLDDMLGPRPQAAEPVRDDLVRVWLSRHRIGEARSVPRVLAAHDFVEPHDDVSVASIPHRRGRDSALGDGGVSNTTINYLPALNDWLGDGVRDTRVFCSIHCQDRDRTGWLAVIRHPHLARHRRDRGNLVGQVTPEAIGRWGPARCGHDKHPCLVDFEIRLNPMNYFADEVLVDNLGTVVVLPVASAAVWRNGDESGTGGLGVKVDDVFETRCVDR